MTNQQKIEITAEAQTATICRHIKEFLNERSQPERWAVNFRTVGERAGIKNLGKVLERPGITLCTVLKVLEALREMCRENEIDISPLHKRIARIFFQ